MKEITGCAKCAEKNKRHIDAYGKVPREEYDKMRDDAKIHARNIYALSWQNASLHDMGDGVTVWHIETFCNVCKEKKIYEGAVVEVIGDDN